MNELILCRHLLDALFEIQDLVIKHVDYFKYCYCDLVDFYDDVVSIIKENDREK